MPTDVLQKKESPTVTQEQVNSEILSVEISKETIKDKIYFIRGQQVMLDRDLSEIYGYTTRKFNEQVKNNKDRFDEDFMFQLTQSEVNALRSDFRTANISSKSRYLPYVFTEQGIYMLMTVLKGDLAIKQSKALIRTFKQMKDYIMNNQMLIEQRQDALLTLRTSQNTLEIEKIKKELESINQKVSDVFEKVDSTVKKSDLSNMMNEFIKEDNGYLIYNSEMCSADYAYSEIYSRAKQSIYLIDNYIGVRTLVHLKNADPNVKITVFSDNIKKLLSKVEYDDFVSEYNITIDFKKTCGIYHDRFIILDYGTARERVFHCGASSRDAGARITSIVEDYGIEKYDAMVNTLLNNPALVLV